MSGEKEITRAVTPEDLGDLLARPPRAAVATVVGGRVDAMPVEFRHAAGRYFVRAPDRLDAGARAVS